MDGPSSRCCFDRLNLSYDFPFSEVIPSWTRPEWPHHEPRQRRHPGRTKKVRWFALSVIPASSRSPPRALLEKEDGRSAVNTKRSFLSKNGALPTRSASTQMDESPATLRPETTATIARVPLGWIHTQVGHYCGGAHRFDQRRTTKNDQLSRYGYLVSHCGST